MIKLNVKAEMEGDKIRLCSNGQIKGTSDLVVAEMAQVLLEFHNINDGDVLIMAFDLMMQRLENNND